MGRDLTAGMEAAISGNRLRRIRFVEMEFESGTLRLCTAGHDLTWDGKLWTGAGHLLSVSPVRETRDIVASETVITLTGVKLANMSLALTEARQNKPGRIWEGARDEVTGAIIADPKLAFAGRLDVVDIDEQAQSSTISVTYESRLADLLRPRERRYTLLDHRIEYPGDRGFGYVPSLQDKAIVWGQ